MGCRRLGKGRVPCGGECDVGVSWVVWLTEKGCMMGAGDA